MGTNCLVKDRFRKSGSIQERFLAKLTRAMQMYLPTGMAM